LNKSLFCALLFLLPFCTSLPQAASHLVLAEIYGGGGDQGSYWTNDYIVLYNPGSTSVNLSSWSVQYAKFNGSTWDVTNLSGSISAGGYYSIQEGGGNRGIEPLPFVPDAIGNIDLDKNKGKVALLSVQTPLTVSNPIGNPIVIDFIGYGNGTNAYEGDGPAEQLGLSSSLRRKDNDGNNTYGTNGNGWDSDNNAGDTYMEIDIVTIPPLPVELSLFSAILKNGKVILNWRTETEVNNYGFEIERSKMSEVNSQTKWTKLGFVEGNGNSNSPKNYSFNDENVNAGKYTYRLKQIDTDGNIEYCKTIEVDLGSPEKFELIQNYPNPFNPTTTISFTLPESGNINLTVYNIIGEQVAQLFNGYKVAGIYTIDFNASELNSGIYIYKIEANGLTKSRKMMLVK